MKNLNLTLSLTEAGKCATKLAQGIDGPVYAMKMQNGKYICGLSFIIAIAGRSAFGDEFDTNATYEILVRLTELNTGNAIDLYGMTFNPKDYIVHSKGGTTYCYFNESAEINDIVLPTDPISASSKYVLKTLVRKKECCWSCPSQHRKNRRRIKGHVNTRRTDHQGCRECHCCTWQSQAHYDL